MAYKIGKKQATTDMMDDEGSSHPLSDLGLDTVSSQSQNRRSRLIRWAIFANGFFLLGSILQVLGAHGKRSWARSIQEYPVSVLQADDDATWQTYLRQRSYESRRLGRTKPRHLQLIPLGEYHGLQWNYLPADTREALNDLWHNARTWDGNPKSQLEGWHWAELDKRETGAAELLGFNEELWDNFEYEQDNYEFDQQWHNNGYNTQVKSNGAGPTEHNTVEAIMTDNVTATGANFKNGSTSNVLDSSNSSRLYQSTEMQSINSSYTIKISEWQQEWSWEQLPGDIKAAMEILGYNEELWVSGGPAFTESLTWNELTMAQQENASLLGYSENNWDEFGSRKDTRDEPVYNEDSPSTLSTEDEKDLGSPPNVSSSNAAQHDLVEASDSETTPSPTPTPTHKPKEASKQTATKLATVTPTDPPPSEAPSKEPTKPPTASPTKAKDPRTAQPTELLLPQTIATFVSKSDVMDETIILSIMEIDVTLTQLYIFFASFCFLVAGTVNWIREAQVFHIWLVQGSISMMLSAVCVGFSEGGAILFRALAYHCYLLEGAFMLKLRKSIRPIDGIETLSYALWVADGMFGSSSVVSIVTTYWQFIDADAAFDLNVALAQELSAWLWLLASFVYMLSPFILAWKTPLDCCQQKANPPKKIHGVGLA
ncbi:expressed unknown protein [Seminavis robusta]|uniref:Uncharacterized protein n=1 Tax=Seminavis robusta TaxID=568900 RepID=A0A9N8EJ31_9STRA|nr:expressed unknown protein [Seminavis robusta]|eukprot:Sro1321_g262480.1 n/a (655) ;mRNA; r:11754-13718